MSLTTKKKESFDQFIGIALLAVLAATGVTLLVPALGSGGMYFLFLTAIIFSTLHEDWRSGAVACVLSIILNFFLLEYLGKSPETFGDWLVLLAFVLASVFTIFLCHTQMESEKARIAAESRYRLIFEHAITGIYETTLDGRYAAANPKLARIFGYETAAQLIEESANLNERFYVTADRRREFARLVEERENIAGFESEIYRHDGEKIWITENALAVRDISGKLVGFQGTTIEITDRKRAEAELQKAHEELEGKVGERTAELGTVNESLRCEIDIRMKIETALRESEEKFRALVEVSSELIWEVDENNIYTYLSPKIKELMGYEPNEILGRNSSMLMSPEEARRVGKIFKQFGSEGAGFVYLESVNIKKNGGVLISETSGVPFYDEAGKLRGYRGIARDITERKRIQNELVASQKQLRHLSAHLQTVREEERKDLARELHDELGQLLTALKIDLVRLNDKSNNGKKTLMAADKNRIPAMVSIVDTAMETTRKIVAELRPGVLDELGLVAALEWQVQEFEKRTGIRCHLTTEFDEDAAYQTLEITIFRISQECLTNIARHSGANQAQIVLREEGSRIFFEVTDNGRGFIEKELVGANSFGILGIRERALLLNGMVKIAVVETGGTCIQVVIPRPPELIKL